MKRNPSGRLSLIAILSRRPVRLLIPPDGSSCARSAGSRKRPAEGSPEREPVRASERGRGGLVGPRTDAIDEGGERVAGRTLETFMGGGDAATRLPSFGRVRA